MNIRFLQVDTTVLLIVLVTLGLIVLVSGIFKLTSMTAQTLINSKLRYISYKAMVIGLGVAMIIFWCLTSQKDSPAIDRYVLSFWPLILALATFFGVNKTASAEIKANRKREKEIEDVKLRQDYENLLAKYEKEKAKNTKRNTKK